MVLSMKKSYIWVMFDYDVMQIVGLPTCPDNAAHEIKIYQNTFHIKKVAKVVCEMLLNKQ